MSYADLELTLRRWSDADDSNYAVELRYEAAGSRAVARSIEGPLPQVQLDLDTLHDFDADPLTYGARLTRALFADPRLLEIFDQAREQAASAQVPLRLRLRLDTTDEAIHSLLWETLQDPEQGGFLCASERLLVSRYLESEDMAALPIRPRADLKALVAVANPVDLEQYKLAPVDIAGEVERCQAALAEISTTVVAHGYGRRATLNNIAAALRDAPDILYLVCHGTTRDGHPYLWLEDDEGAIGRVEGEEFVACLERLEQRPSLIVLASCRSAGHSRAAGALAALGPRLAAAGIAAVVAMQGDITMETVAAFMPTFFSELRRDGQIDRALAAARAGVLGRPDWWMPVLFLRARDGMIWSEPELPPPPEPERPPRLSDFVGREAEIESFAERLAAQHLAVITGMPGVGKTALATALAGRLVHPDKLFWHTFHEDEGIDVIIWKLAGFLAHNQQDELWRMLERARQTGGQPPPPAVLLDYLIQLLRGRHYLLCLDDFHFVADDPLLDQLIERLRAELGDGGTALLITSRQMPIFAQEEALALEGMSAEDTNLLLHTRGLELAPELATELHAYTGGNAQVLTLAIDRLLRAQSPAALIAQLSEVENIERFLIAEVDADLSEEERAVMGAVAALLGYPGTRAALEAISDRGGLRPTLRGLCDRYLLTVTEREDRREYGQHAIVRAFYYDTLSRSERLALHQRAGEYYDAAEPHPLKAARHFERAGDYPRAARLATGDLWSIVNRGQARALHELLALFQAQQLDADTWIGVCLARGEVGALLGAREQAQASYQTALDRLAALPESPAVRERLARACRGMGELLEAKAPQEALAWLRRGIDELAGANSPEEGLLKHRVGSVLTVMGEYGAARDALQESLDRLPESQPMWRGRVLANLGVIYCSQGDIERGKAAFLEVLDIYQGANNYWGIATIRQNLGRVMELAGDWLGATGEYQQALELAEQLGNIKRQSELKLNLGNLQAKRGELAAAGSLLAQSLELAHKYHLQAATVLAQSSMADLQIRQGRSDTAESALVEAERLALELNIKHQLPEIYRSWSQLKLARGAAEAAIADAERALSIARELADPIAEGMSLRALGQALQVADRSAAAADAFAQSLALLDGRDTYEAARTQVQWARALAPGAGRAQSAALLRSARATFEQLGAQHDLEGAEEQLVAEAGAAT
jgi:tetratricopeptide (TPR) repeat protein